MTDNDEICEERMRSLRFSPDPNAVWAHEEITRLSNELTRTQRELAVVTLNPTGGAA